jgi:hypothetical protein
MPPDDTRESFLRVAADRCREAIRVARTARAADRDQRAFRIAIRRITSAYHIALGEAARRFPEDIEER